MFMEEAGIVATYRGNYFLDLEGTYRKIRGNNYQIIVKWNPIILQTGSPPQSIDIHENGNLIVTLQDYIVCFYHQSNYTIIVSGRNLPPSTYKIYLSGANKCSSEVVINFN